MNNQTAEENNSAVSINIVSADNSSNLTSSSNSLTNSSNSFTNSNLTNINISKSTDSIISSSSISNSSSNNVTEERYYFPVPSDTVNDTTLNVSSAEGSAIITTFLPEEDNQADTTANTNAQSETEETTTLLTQGQEDGNSSTAVEVENVTVPIEIADLDNLNGTIAERTVQRGNVTDDLSNTNETNTTSTLEVNTLSNVNLTLTNASSDNSTTVATVSDITSLEVSNSAVAQVSDETSTETFTSAPDVSSTSAPDVSSTTAPDVSSTSAPDVSTTTAPSTFLITNTSVVPQQGFSQSSPELPEFLTTYAQQKNNTTVSKRPDPSMNNGTIEPQNDENVTLEGLPEPELPVSDGVEGESVVQEVCLSCAAFVFHG